MCGCEPKSKVSYSLWSEKISMMKRTCLKPLTSVRCQINAVVNFGYIAGSDALIKRKSVICMTIGRKALDKLLGGAVLDNVRTTFILRSWV
ncbi:uncharacterized protein [Euphorbia lathyris]|uniref:uncharacterized protein isoform X3 n=1 Tax=Euphorbia lathyris TaxID=212925 RepID=UPI003313BCE8